MIKTRSCLRKGAILLAFGIVLPMPSMWGQAAKNRLPLVPPTRTQKAFPMEEGFVDAGGVLIYYKTMGRGAPLLVAHGGPGASHDYLLPYLLPLARTNQLVL